MTTLPEPSPVHMGHTVERTSSDGVVVVKCMDGHYFYATPDVIESMSRASGAALSRASHPTAHPSSRLHIIGGTDVEGGAS